MADEIEKGRKPLEIIKEFLSNHKRIIFGGDGYSAEWEKEAKERGLSNKKDTVDAIECLKDKKLTEMLVDLGIYSNVEINSRYEILLENYRKIIQVEALTALKMAKTQIYPATIAYLNVISNTAYSLKNNNIENSYLIDDVTELSNLVSNMKNKIENLNQAILKAQNTKSNARDIAKVWRDDVLTAMNDLRKIVDLVETKVDSKYWPIPTYVDLLFGI